MRGLGGAIGARSRLDQRDIAIAVAPLPYDEPVAARDANLAEGIDEASGFNRQGEDDSEIG